MTPWELASKSEHSQQRALFAWANCAALYGFAVANSPAGYVHLERGVSDWVYAPVPALKLLFAIHNQGHGDRIRGAQAKAEGVKAGVPDIMLPVPRGNNLPHPYAYNGLFIELKRPGAPKVRAGKESKVQTDWIAELRAQGYRAKVCIGWEAAAQVIEDYMR